MNAEHVPAEKPSAIGALLLKTRLLLAGARMMPVVQPYEAGYAVEFRPGWLQKVTPVVEQSCLDAVHKIRGDTFRVDEKTEEPFTLPRFNPSCFSGILDAEAHVATAWEILCANAARDFADPAHCCFIGPPACAKSLVAAGFEKMLGRDAWRVDLSRTTTAGFPRLIMQKAEGRFPRVLILEEMDKAKQGVLQVLIPLLDSRQLAQDMRVERGKAVERSIPVRCMLIGTANSWGSLQKKLEGAIASRVTPLPMDRPDRARLTEILTSYATMYGMDVRIVPCVVRFMFDVLHESDPRKAKALMSKGSKWLDGSARKELRRIYGL